MKLTLLLSFLIFMATASHAGPGAQCKSGAKKQSCENVEGAVRKSFCWKGELSKKKKEKICTVEKKKLKKMKKSIKKKIKKKTD
jgi:hypothetical protein